MTGKVQRILCVDDQPANLLALEAVIDLPGVELLKADSGEAALQALLAHDDIALALLDVQMGGMDGYEVAELMRGHARSRDIPIIFLTAINKEQQYVFRGYDSGAVDYLFKPLEPRILLGKVRVFLELDRRKRELADALREVRALRENTDALLRSLGEGILGVDTAGRVTFANPAAAALLGMDPAALAGRALETLLEAGGLSAAGPATGAALVQACAGDTLSLSGLRAELACADGRRIPVEVTLSALRDEAGRQTGAALVFQDVSQRREYEQRLIRLAEYDTLTGLANRYLCLNLAGQAVARASRAGSKLALLFLDLDRFKQVNDTLGHAAGDELLREVAQRLRQCVREGDSVCRLGGDEFVILVEGLNAPRDAAVVARKVIEALGRPFALRGTQAFIGASVGIVTAPDTEGDANTLLRCADIAMYQAKARGRNNFQFFTRDMQDAVLEAQRLESDLRRALAGNEFVLSYQPQIDARTGTISGIEALVRWRRPDGELVMPTDFIPLAEETGLIVELDDWVLNEACAQSARWHAAGLSNVPVCVSVNLSSREVRSRAILDTLQRALDRSGMAPDQLVVEITEHMVMGAPEAVIGLVRDIKALGVRVALDDFGIGYSSFSQLRRMSLDAIKIDRSLISGIEHGERDREVVRAIVALGHALGLQVMAEAVETAAQRDLLVGMGVDALQGYCLYRPLTPAQLEAEVGALRQRNG